MFCEVDVAVPMDKTSTTLTRFPRVLIRTSPCGACHAISVTTSPRADAVRRAASANGHAVRQAPFDDPQRPNECQRGGAACHTPSDVPGRAGDADQ